jgi:lipoprotein-anchoring transpeptidase ErfK/SrfK
MAGGLVLRISLGALLLAGGCGGGPTDPGTAGSFSPEPRSSRSLRLSLPTSRPTPSSRFTEFPAYAATAVGREVVVRSAPDGAVTHTLGNPQPSGAPLTFLLKSDRRGWLEVYLPVRPNGSSGWVREADVRVEGLRYRIDVSRSAHTLRLYRDGELVEELPVAIGKENTPTPGGVFYLKELLIPTNEGGFYGPYAYGLSGFSNVLTRFAGGEGVIGLHGTNDPSSIGKDVSSGCIRLRNADITRLAKLLPLGTPVNILE